MAKPSKPFVIGLSPRIDAAFQSTEALYRAVGHNCGNLAFTHAVHAHLGGDLPTTGWYGPFDKGDVAVFPAANQLGAHWAATPYLANRFRQAGVPIVMVGLGAQSNVQGTIPAVSPRTVDWLRAVVAQAGSGAPNIGVRGAFTMDVLGSLGLDANATIVGCPSFFLNPDPRLGSKIAGNLGTPERVAVGGGHPGWRHLRRIERSLGQLVRRTNGSYIGQTPLEMMRLGRGEARSMAQAWLEQCRDYVCPDMALGDFVDWSIRHVQVFFDIHAWIEHCKRFDFIVGTRIHGAIMGLQAGVPSLCIAHDSRTLELCETLKVPHVLARDVIDGLAHDDLLRHFQFDAAAFDANRRALCRRYVAFLRSNKLTPRKWLVKLGEYEPEQARADIPGS